MFASQLVTNILQENLNVYLPPCRKVCCYALASPHSGGISLGLRQLAQASSAILFKHHQQILLHHSLCVVACLILLDVCTVAIGFGSLC